MREGAPSDIVRNRDKGHHKNEQRYEEAILDKASDNRDAIRGREQQLIEANGGAKSSGGSSGNAINGIASGNPKRDDYINAANEAFGPLGGAKR